MERDPVRSNRISRGSRGQYLHKTQDHLPAEFSSKNPLADILEMIAGILKRVIGHGSHDPCLEKIRALN